MTEKRLTTVYDYSDLRIHPDGTRVKQQAINLRPKATVQDARANWIARDAGGFAVVPRFRKKGSVEEGESVVDIEDGIDFSEEEGSDKKIKSKRPDARTTKRQKFMKNDDYLVEDASPSVIHAGTSYSSPDFATFRSFSLPDPSPDLLKCIHRFTAEFYSERGQLLNSSRHYRKQRKERKKRRQQVLQAKTAGCDTSSSSSFDSESKNDQQNDGQSEAECGDEIHVKEKRPWKGRRQSEQLYVDMYKVFDGSAMMALGMLVQEHITHLLAPVVAVDWEDEVHSAYSEPWGHTSQAQAMQSSPNHTEDDEGAEPSFKQGNDAMPHHECISGCWGHPSK